MPRPFLLLALLAAEAGAPARRIVPRGPGAAHYESRPAAETQLNLFGDPLRGAIVKALIDAGRRRGVKVVPDTRLDGAMADLARSLREGEQPHNAAVEFVLSHHGIVEPYPMLRLARGHGEQESGAVNALLGDMSFPETKALVTAGVGIDRTLSSVMIIVATQEKSLDLDPVRRQLPTGTKTRVSGRLLAGHVKPYLYVTDPRGAVRTLPAEAKGAQFAADVACDRGDGRYQVEVFGTGARGPAVLANFPLYCGMAPPAFFDGAAGYPPGAPLRPADAEVLLLTLVNRDRQTAGLPPLVADPALAAVARAHSQDMLANDFVGHISPTTGGPEERVKRAGIPFRHLAENVGRNSTVEELELGLMGSPGHRSAILDGQSTQVGIGVAIATPTANEVVIYGTQLFR